LIEPREERSLAAKLRQVARAWQIERQVSKEKRAQSLSRARPVRQQSGRAFAPPRSPISARSRDA